MVRKNLATFASKNSSVSATVWTSHRGLCLDAVENTQASFNAARSAGFCSFETDLRVSSDGHIVLCHDENFSRLSGPETPVQSMSRSEIEKIRLSDGSHPFFFDDFIDQYAAYNWIFDIKPEHGEKTIEALSLWLDEKSAAEWFFSHARFLFWSDTQQQEFRQAFPAAIFLATRFECWRAGIMSLLGLSSVSGIVSGKTFSLKPRSFGFSFFEKRHLDFYQQKGAKLLAYLPSTEIESRRALEVGFDEILTNGLIYEK